MNNYLNNLEFSISVNKKSNKSKRFDYFYWKYIYGDFIISKFINFLVKSGHKNRAIKLFFKALHNLKSKFGINPILLVKYIILKRNVLHKVTKKKVKQKTFYYLRLLDFEKQISHTIKKIMEFIFFLKDKKHLQLWQSIYIVLLNFCLLKNKKKKKIEFKHSSSIYIKNVKRILRTFSLVRAYIEIKNKFLNIYISFKKIVFYFSKIFVFFLYLKSYILRNILSGKSIIALEDVLLVLSYLKRLRYYLTVLRYKLVFFKDKYSFFLKKARKKMKKFFVFFRRFKKKHISRKVALYKRKKFRKKILSRNKFLLRLKYRQHFLTRFFFKDLVELKKASKFKNSFLNFKLRNKKRRELEMGTRIHSKHDVRLRHRKIFFRVSKYGQIKN